MQKRLSNSVRIKSTPEKEISILLKEWATKASLRHSEIIKVGYFGSYARGDYTPSSDLDVIIVIKSSDKPPHKRLIDYSIDNFPVGCEIFVYTKDELFYRKSSFMQTIQKEAKWLFQRD